MENMNEPRAAGDIRLKYAQIERERRFWISTLPDGAPREFMRIVDRYISGTRLRLRRMERPNGAVIDRKLGQKFAFGNVAVNAMMTNIYLDEAEYQTLLALPAQLLTKRRYSIDGLSVDCFEGALEGLVLAEKEFLADDEAARYVPPAWAAREVTDDPFFRGGSLITLSTGALQERLRRMRSGEAKNTK